MISGLTTSANAGDDLSGAMPAPLNYSGMTKTELLSLAADQGITGVSTRNTKADIIAALEGE